MARPAREGLRRAWISWTTCSHGSSWPTMRMGTAGADAERWTERQGGSWSPANAGAGAAMAVPIHTRSTSVTYSIALRIMRPFTA